MRINKLKLPSCPAQIGEVEVFLKSISEKYGIAPDKFPDMLISLTEAVNNAIIHGNGSDISKFVKISFSEKKNNILVFKITDEGEGFNPTAVPDPTSAELLECCGGRGVHIMKCLCDDVSFKENGRTVLLKFKL